MEATTLRPLDDADLDGVSQLLSDPSLFGGLGLDGDPRGMRSPTAIRRKLEPLVASTEAAAWVVESGGLVGFALADWWWDAMTPSAHVVIGPRHRRMGHGGRAAREVVADLFSRTPAVIVQYSAAGWDPGALRFADAVGGSRCGAHRRTGIHEGRYHDTVVFALERSTWEERHAAER